jgi:hypothetical protein
MNLNSSLVDWKNYVRNRLLSLLGRAGRSAVFSPLNGDSRTIAGLIVKHDMEERSIMDTIERYVMHVPEDRCRFGALQNIPVNGDPEVFATALNDHHALIIEFLSGMKEQEFSQPVIRPGLQTELPAGWLIQLAILREQSLIDQIQSMLNANGIPVTAPWATKSFFRPVRKLNLR